MTAAAGTVALESPPVQPGLGSASPAGPGSIPPEAVGLALGCGVTGFDADGIACVEALGRGVLAEDPGAVGIIEGTGDVGPALVEEVTGGLTTAVAVAGVLEPGALEAVAAALVDAPTLGVVADVVGASFFASPQLLTAKAKPRSCVV